MCILPKPMKPLIQQFLDSCQPIVVTLYQYQSIVVRHTHIIYVICQLYRTYCITSIDTYCLQCQSTYTEDYSIIPTYTTTNIYTYRIRIIWIRWLKRYPLNRTYTNNIYMLKVIIRKVCIPTDTICFIQCHRILTYKLLPS